MAVVYKLIWSWWSWLDNQTATYKAAALGVFALDTFSGIKPSTGGIEKTMAIQNIAQKRDLTKLNYPEMTDLPFNDKRRTFCKQNLNYKGGR